MYKEVEFPEGKLSMYGKNAINQNATIEETAATAQRLNEPHNLERIITNPDAILANKLYPDGTNFSILLPTGPYSDRALMIGVYNRNIFEDGESHFIYDYPEEIQREYWGTVLLGLHANEEILREERKRGVIPVWGENSTTVSDHLQRTSRTIRFPHGHFMEIDPDRIHPSSSALRHLQEEQDVLERKVLVERFATRVLQRMPEHIDELLPQLTVRNSPPRGYGFSLVADPTSQNIEKIARIMKAHHQAYFKVSSRIIDVAKRVDLIGDNLREKLNFSVPSQIQEGENEIKKRGIKPPSYRTYMFFNEGKLDVVISPEFWSHGGVVEAMNINLDRSSSHPEVVSKEEKRAHGERFVSIIAREKAKVL